MEVYKEKSSEVSKLSKLSTLPPKLEKTCCEKFTYILKELLPEFFFSEAGILSVYIVSYYGKVNNIAICSGLSLIVALIFPSYSLTYLASSFGGIMSNETFPSMGYYFVSGFLVFFLLLITKNIFLQTGGKVGTATFLSNFLTLVLAYIYYLIGSVEFDIIKTVYDPYQYELITPWVFTFGPLFASLSSFLTYLLGKHRNCIEAQTSRVFTYGTISLIGAIYFQTFTLDYYRYAKNNKTYVLSYGLCFLNFWHTGAVAAMTSEKKFDEYLTIEHKFLHFIITGYMAGWILISLSGVSLLGGKHGLSGFLANLFYFGFVTLIQKLKVKKSN